MIVVLKNDITSAQKTALKKFLGDRGFKVKEIAGQEETVLGAVGKSSIDYREVEVLDGVKSVLPISKPYKLASRELKKEDTIVQLRNNVRIGGNRLAVIAGPCAVESREQMMTIAASVREAGAVILRGGAFKPRTSPYSFQGLGEEGLKYLREAGDKFGMPVTTEIVSPSDVDMMKDYIDMFQIGARNMQNFELLKAVGRTGMPVLLKRGIAATIEEWLMAAEYLMANGTDQIVLCERGIRTYERLTRNTLDCSAIPMIQKLTHLPVIGDPSHATGIRDLVSPMSLAIVASGASGLMIEVHNHPECALSDGPQSLLPVQFEKLMRDIQVLCPVVGKSLERIPRIIPESLVSEKKTNTAPDHVVSFQGERGAFSELAVRRTFDENVDVLPCRKFRDVFESVMSGTSSFGVIPIENTLGGTIIDNIDLLMRYPSVKVVGEREIRIIHNLIAVPGTDMKEIRKVYSHPQGLAQCHEFLEREMPYAEAVPFFDTAGAVSYIAEQNDRTKAAIAGAPAAAYHKMELLREGIETDPKNYTRFFIICRDDMIKSYPIDEIRDTAAISFSVKNHAGALFEVLQILSDMHLNMRKLESRPIAGKPWEYSFFAEVQFEDRKNFDDAEKLIREKAASYSFLGAFKGAH